jgi:hypothetical protein
VLQLHVLRSSQLRRYAALKAEWSTLKSPKSCDVPGACPQNPWFPDVGDFRDFVEHCYAALQRRSSIWTASKTCRELGSLARVRTSSTAAHHDVAPLAHIHLVKKPTKH